MFNLLKRLIFKSTDTKTSDTTEWGRDRANIVDLIVAGIEDGSLKVTRKQRETSAFETYFVASEAERIVSVERYHPRSNDFNGIYMRGTEECPISWKDSKKIWNSAKEVQKKKDKELRNSIERDLLSKL